MKYGESIFDVLYLLFAISAGIYMTVKARTKVGKGMGIAALLLGTGDAFHLIPRVLNYFIESDFALALGVGKLVTSITMTAFYVVLYYVWILRYKEKYSVTLSLVVTISAFVRIVLCAFPQNGWFDNGGDLLWSILRNVPFVVLGATVCYLFFTKRKEDRGLYPVWICILLSFAFYLPVAIGASYVPLLGMLMLPKTVCYVVMIVLFLRFVIRKEADPTIKE